MKNNLDANIQQNKEKKWFKLHLDWQCLAVASVMRLPQTHRMCTSLCSEKAGTPILLYPRSSSNRSIRRPNLRIFLLGKSNVLILLSVYSRALAVLLGE